MHFFRIFFLVIVASNSAFAQQFENYQLLRSRGEIPTDFTTPSSHKFEAAKENLTNTNSKVGEVKQSFLLESNFLIDQVLGSGRVLFNDPISEYLGEILDTILVNEPNLRKKIRAYAVRSSIVNSFTTDDGIILVNLGLIAQLENEAQLAFILCHEIAHYTEHHIINAYIQNEEIKNDGEFKRGTFDEKMLARSRYSKDLEKEADKLGVERFLETNYGTSSLLNVFEVMRYAHLPFEDVPFDKTFFNAGYYGIDDAYFLSRVRQVKALDNDDAEHSTHPSPTERQQLMSRFLTKADEKSRSDYLISDEVFLRLRNVCRFELSNLYLQANRPVMSLYNSFLLSRSYSNNFYLKKQIAISLCTLSKHKTAGNFGYVHPGFSHIEGESQQVYHLLYQLKPEELAVLATGYLWRLKKEFPDDTDVAVMSTDLLDDLMGQFYVPGMFSKVEPPAGWNEPDTSDIDNKYDILKQKSKNNSRLAMVEYALVDLFEEVNFAVRFDSLEQKYWGAKSERIPSESVEKKSKEDLRQWRNHGFKIGAEKVVVVSPTYAKLDLRKKQQHRFLHSESAKKELITQINRSADLLNLEVQILDQSELDSSGVEEFNDIVFLSEWVDHRFSQLDVSMVNMPHDHIDLIIDKYGTEFFSWTGVINYRENKPLMFFYLLYALIPPAIPFATYYLVRPNFDTYYYNITFNLKTGEPVLVNYNNYRKRDSPDMINSSVYDSFWQMKRKP